MKGHIFPIFIPPPPSPNFCQNNLEIKMFGIYSNRAAVCTRKAITASVFYWNLFDPHILRREKKTFTLLLVLDLLYGRYYSVVTGNVFWGVFGWRSVHIYIQMMLSNISVSWCTFFFGSISFHVIGELRVVLNCGCW